MLLTAGTRLGPYEILSQIGAGGMGEVYEARDTRLDRTVAVKVLGQQRASSEELQRFEPIRTALEAADHVDYITLHAKNVSQAVAKEAEGA